MRWSNLFIPTLRDVPADAEVASHKLLLRAGYIRQLGAGIYSLLPLAKRSINKIEEIVREEMNRIGGQEFDLPALNPDDIWKESGRWETMGENMFRLKDRGGRELCLGMTHEEVFTVIARDELRSYRELPQIWYQIQVKFRDEPRPKSGLLRVRQFTMKDSYSFDIDFAGLDKNYDLHDLAYRRIFDRCGLRYLAIKAASGAMGGSESQEFVVYSDAGEDWVVSCPGCGYAANLETAVSYLEDLTEDESDSGKTPKEVHTPNQKTIEEVSTFLRLPKNSHIKTLVIVVESKPNLILLRGDHQLNEAKLAAVLGTETFRPGTPEEVRMLLGADPGSLGPVGVENIPIFADAALQNRKNMICGANRDDYHLKFVTPGRDFHAQFVNLRSVSEGEGCPDCRKPLKVAKAIEIGHIFKLGLKYSESMGATVLDQNGEEKPIVMGSYGIGIGRVLATAVELYHDADGMILPPSIAPFQVVITLLRPDDHKHKKIAEELYEKLNNSGIDCLLDDRNERPGVKFKDADLIGIPVRITLGKKLSEGQVEVFGRSNKNLQIVDLDCVIDEVQKILDHYSL